MKNKIFLFILLLAVTFSFYSCEFGVPDENNPDNTAKVTVSGQVVESITGNPVYNASVKITDGDTSVTARTNSDGYFNAQILIFEDKELSIITYLEGYSTDTTKVYAAVGSTINVPLIKVKQSQGTGGTVSGAASSIRLVSQSATSIGVIESGSNETAQITFEVLDSTGVAINSDNAVVVNFTFGAVPGGGEYLYPSSIQTNALGRATVTLNTGTKAGVAQIISEVVLPNRTIRSEPVLLAIHGGFPDPAHFAVASNQLNYPFYGIIGAEIEFTGFAGDKYSNPVRPGTSVYFNSNSGIIAGSAQTDELGRATVTLLTQPFPDDPVFGAGFFTVDATTVDENNTSITTNTVRLLSGHATIHDVNPGTFDLENGGAQDIDFMVSDGNGNPLATGANISVSVSDGDVKVSGDISILMPDTQSRSYTMFSFSVYDSKPEEDLLKRASVTISVSGANGTATYTISGTAR